MLTCKVPISLFEDVVFGKILSRFGSKGFGAVVRAVLYFAHRNGRIELYAGAEEVLAQRFGVSLGLMLDLITYGEKLGLFCIEEEGASFYLRCPVLENAASKEVENTDPFLKCTQNPEKTCEIGQNLISESCADVLSADGKKEKKKQKKKEDINNNLLNKIPYGESKVVYLTEAEHEKLLQKFGAAKTQQWIEKLESYIHVFPVKAKKYASHYHVILTWARNDAKSEAEPLRSLVGYGNVRCLN